MMDVVDNPRKLREAESISLTKQTYGFHTIESANPQEAK